MQHEAGPERERAGDAEPALLAVGEHARVLVGALVESEQRQQLVGAPARLARRGAGAERRHLDVLAHAEAAEEPAVLEGAREAGAAAAVGRPAA